MVEATLALTPMCSGWSVFCSPVTVPERRTNNWFKFQKETPAVPDKPFFSKLPQAMSSHKNGSALGVFGQYVERAWQTSIATAGVGKQLQPFEHAFHTILSGRPLGHALTGFVNRANEMSRLLTGKIDEGKADDAEMAGLWLTRNDAEFHFVWRSGGPVAQGGFAVSGQTVGGQVGADTCWIRIRIFGQDADGLYRVEAELDDGSWHKQMMKLGDDEMGSSLFVAPTWAP